MASAEPETNNWPGAFGIFKPSLRTVAFNLAVYLATILIVVPISFIPNIIQSTTDSTSAGILSNIVIELLTIVLAGASTLVLLAACESKRLTFGAAFNRTFELAWRLIGVTLLTYVIAIASLIALIVPFFFVMPRIFMASYYVLDQDMGVMEALKASWNNTKGHVGKVYGIVGVNILMALLFITIIGIPVAIFLLVAYGAAFPILYKYILSGQLKHSIQDAK